MRPTLVLLLVLSASLAQAQTDARVTFLSKQLATAKDPRVRVQAALVLGASQDPAAVTPLCNAMKDPEAVVRSAAAKSLGDLRDSRAVACLSERKKDASADVQLAVAKALELLARPGGKSPLYVSIDPVVDKSGDLPPDVLKLAEELLKSKLTKMGANFAPPGESKAAALSLIRSKKLKGFLFKVNLQPTATNGLKIDLLVMTYPEQSIQGSWNVKAAGAKPADLLKLMVPKVVDDAAEDLEWSR
jgi:hypothetical protein